MRPRAVACLLALAGTAAAQAPVAPAPPSRADSLIARGRLFAAEQELYSAVNRNPRAPAVRGELGRYLASRARFTIADVLFAEALRFGADTTPVAQALMAMAPYRPEVDRRTIPGVRLPAAEGAREAARLAGRTAGATRAAEVAPAPGGAAGGTVVPFMPSGDGTALGAIDVRGPGGVRRAWIDPRVQGVVLASASDAALRPRAFGATGAGAPLLLDEVFIGARRLAAVEARVAPELAPDEVRVGLDVLWSLRPEFDDRAGTMTLPPAGPRALPPRAVQIPIALAFPGLWLVPVVGEPPVSITSARGRALLRNSRWWWDATQATIVVSR